MINFDILDRHRDAMRAQGWALILIDEFQNASNSDAKRTQAIDGAMDDLDNPLAVPVADYLNEPLPSTPARSASS